MRAITVNGLTKSFVMRQTRVDSDNGAETFENRFFRFRRRRSVVVTKTALSPTTFAVDAGESIAFMGPNGAGKSTTIKMLTGILYPSGGEASVLGMTPWLQREQLAYQIGTVFGQKSQLWYHLPASDTFDLMAHIYDLKRADYRARRKELIAAFGLEEHMGTPVRKLSLGERMRAEIAVALLHRPRILFLDEPTIGLDVVVKQTIRTLISRLNKEEGVTVFLTSHDPGDIEEMCARALVINHGELLFDGHIDELKRRYWHHKTIHLQLKAPVFQFCMEGVEVEVLGEKEVRLRVDLSLQAMEPVLAAAVSHYPIDDVTIENPGFDYAIAQMYQSKTRSGAG